MFKAVFLLVLLVLLSGCSMPEKVSSEARSFTVQDINPPKRMYVKLKDTENGQVYSNVYVAKRCSRWKELKVGSEVKLIVSTYRRANGEHFTRIENARSLCPGRA